jgi:RNA polymerase sigma-70 factor (ECF subfamily)
MAVVSVSPRMIESSDEQLLESFQQGDRLALEELFQRYRDTAFRVAFRLLGREADALDAVQDGFIKALTHLDGFEHRSSFKTWLLRIVSNASLDLGRQRRRRETLSLEATELREHEVDPKTLTDAAGNAVDHADLRESLDRALRELPEAQRRTFVLHVDAEMSYREIAETLGISIGTVMSRLFYARQKLKGLLSSRTQS